VVAIDGAGISSQEAGSAIEAQRDPAWSALDVLRLAFIAIVALFVGVFAVLFAVHFGLRPHSSLGSLARVPLVVVADKLFPTYSCLVTCTCW